MCNEFILVAFEALIIISFVFADNQQRKSAQAAQVHLGQAVLPVDRIVPGV
jgi:hypothetical protein